MRGRERKESKRGGGDVCVCVCVPIGPKKLFGGGGGERRVCALCSAVLCGAPDNGSEERQGAMDWMPRRSTKSKSLKEREIIKALLIYIF
jgi:hypothetical protein